MKTVWKIYWDNGAHACGTFPQAYDSEMAANQAAATIEAENLAEGVWDEDGFCEVIEVEEPDEEDGWDEMGELHKAALNRGQP